MVVFLRGRLIKLLLMVITATRAILTYITSLQHLPIPICLPILEVEVDAQNANQDDTKEAARDGSVQAWPVFRSILGPR